MWPSAVLTDLAANGPNIDQIAARMATKILGKLHFVVRALAEYNEWVGCWGIFPQWGYYQTPPQHRSIFPPHLAAPVIKPRRINGRPILPAQVAREACKDLAVS